MSEAARILVVEDEAAIAEGLALNLGLKGYDVGVAGDGRKALEKLEAEDWDLVLLDVRLPEVDGFEVCQRLRARGDFTPVLMLTARTQPDDVVYGLKLGADDYVTKPFDLAELLARVEGLLRRRRWARGGEPGDGAAPAPEPRVAELLEPDAEVYQALVMGLRDYVAKNGFDRVVLGLSGGIDSALVAAIAVHALGPDRVTAVVMPSPYSSSGTQGDARDLARHLGIECLEYSIKPAMDAYEAMLSDTFAGREPDITEENLQAR
ncbi:MAG TPA: NAD(+) synthase, partial [Thermoanaerobaculia bacterium]|nr:NAD(+) synthase [Thermoanaerobaculia bacterium]